MTSAGGEQLAGDMRSRPRGERGDGTLQALEACSPVTLVRAFGVVVGWPSFDHDPGLRERIENLPIQQLVPEAER